MRDLKCIGTIGRKYFGPQAVSFVERGVLTSECPLLEISLKAVYYPGVFSNPVCTYWTCCFNCIEEHSVGCMEYLTAV